MVKEDEWSKMMVDKKDESGCRRRVVEDDGRRKGQVVEEDERSKTMVKGNANQDHEDDRRKGCVVEEKRTSGRRGRAVEDDG